jgi:anti-sigma regulatory factor (Ser/Thr protein kinase)
VPASRFRGRYLADASCVGVIRGEVEAVGRERGLEGEELGDVRLAVSEAATNAVVHGSAGRDGAHVGVRVDLTDLEMLVTVCDEGGGLKPRIVAGPGMGAGLSIIAAITGRLDVRSNPEGTEVRMAFPCPVAAKLKEAADHVHESAVLRLEDALVEQDRLGKRFDEAVGTSTEFGAYVRLRGAGEQVTARQAWVNWVEHESDRRINPTSTA